MKSEKENLDEFLLIKKYFQPLAGPGSFDLTDDVAHLLSPKLICSNDILVEGVHFFADDPAGLIAKKVLRTNISDIVAKGAVPEYYMLGVVFTQKTDELWIERFAKGLQEDQDLYGMRLLGGDTTRHQKPSPLVVSLTIFGRPLSDRSPVLRSGASTGDLVFLSGTIGDAGLGLMVRSGDLSLSAGANRFLKRRYLLPDPKIALAEKVSAYASAALDISDGLLADADHLCKASEVSMELSAEKLPISDAANSWLKQRKEHDPGLAALAAMGDDYEILCTVPADGAQLFQTEAAGAGVSVTAIGRCVAPEGYPKVTLLSKNGAIIVAPTHGFNHFSQN